MATVAGHPGFVGDCADRVLPGRSREPVGYGEFSGFQLKIIQEAITITIFIIFAITFLKEKMAWNNIVAFLLLILAALFAFKPSVVMAGS